MDQTATTRHTPSPTQIEKFLTILDTEAQQRRDPLLLMAVDALLRVNYLLAEPTLRGASGPPTSTALGDRVREVLATTFDDHLHHLTPGMAPEPPHAVAS